MKRAKSILAMLFLIAGTWVVADYCDVLFAEYVDSVNELAYLHDSLDDAIKSGADPDVLAALGAEALLMADQADAYYLAWCDYGCDELIGTGPLD
ncbi:MAG: hypothetical protein QNK37_24715 [Acidobacteriota bacterium]|nr:hypothetical protein [Acidobacteriota bacterium]